MKSKKLWIITIILLAIHLIIQYALYLKIDLTSGLGIISFITDLAGNLIFIILLGAVLGCLFAIIPFKEKTYTKKLKYTFALSISFILLLLIISYGFLVFYGKQKNFERRPTSKYQDINIPGNINCSSVHNGNFETDNITIERMDDTQIQTHKKTGKKEIFKVIWTNDCEYKIIPLEDSLLTIKVKITTVNEEGYCCYVIPEKFANKSAIFYKIRYRKEN